MESKLGSRLPDYEVIRPLGRGAYSYVYHVKYRSTSQEFALKIIEKQVVVQKNLTNRLLNEIKLQKRLNHPCIVKFYHSFEDEDSIYLVLEYCAGGELFNYIKSEGRLSEDETRMLCSQLVDGIDYLHNRGILHRDLKLGNLLLSEDRTLLKIGDFGLAVKLSNYSEERSTLCGTPNYISPEVVNRQPYGLAADLWSLGCIVYGCLTGNPPFESPDIQTTLLKIKDMSYSLPSYLSDDAEKLIRSLLSWNPDERLSIQDVKNQPFFKSQFFTTLDTRTLQSPTLILSPVSKHRSATYVDYTETIISPEKPGKYDLPRSNRKIKSLKQDPFATPRSKPIVIKMPLSTANLLPFKHISKNRVLEINDKGWVIVSMNNRQLEVSSDGMTVIYQGRLTNFREMNNNCAKLYQYAQTALDLVRSKTPKIKLQIKDAMCMLMWNEPYPNFEVDFENGARVCYQIGSGKLYVHPLTGGSFEISPSEDYEHLDQNLKNIVDTTLEGLKSCIDEERKLKVI